MLRFKHYLQENYLFEASKNGAKANENGVRHELMTLGVMNHMSKHYSGSEKHPNLLTMNDDELRNHYNTHVKTGKFNKEMPEHFRDKDGQTPKQVHSNYTTNLDDDEHFNHFKNSVEHVKKLHEHLEKRGFDPKTIGNVSWTSKDGDVNNYMKKHGKNPNRTINPQGDDFDGAASIKDKHGNNHHFGFSMKWGSQKGAAPTLKNNTHNTVLSKEELSPEYAHHADFFKAEAQKHINTHQDEVKEHYPQKSDKARHNAFVSDADSETNSPETKDKLKSVEQSNLKRNAGVAKALHKTLSSINNDEKAKGSTSEISNYIRRKASISSPDIHAVRGSMTINPNTNEANGHHFEDHSSHLNNLLGNTHHFKVSHSGGSVHIDAHDKEGKHLFRFTNWSKGGSRAVDQTTKILSKVSKANPSLDEKNKEQ